MAWLVIVLGSVGIDTRINTSNSDAKSEINMEREWIIIPSPYLFIYNWCKNRKGGEYLMRGKEIDLTQTSINIDALLDVYVQTQKEAGKDPELEERNLVIDDSGNLVRSNKPKEEQKEKKSVGLGSFYDLMSDELMDEEDEGPYVCEYCSDIGYRKEYKPHICDTCDTCGVCTEYQQDECSGCEYSIYRTGRLYGEELRSHGVEVQLEEEEQNIIRTIQSRSYDNKDDELLTPSLSFTVMDYDHKTR